MPNVKEITRESWILATFPEWGTWLNEEIEEEVVPEGNFAMWWLGNCGTWIKTPAGANVVMDLWSNRGKSTKNPNHSYLSQLDVTYKTPDLMSHFLPPHEVSFTFCCSSIVFPR
ncbi:putative L-ascorbate-6-phosphate lactonase UlaG [Streptococcus pneumoniae]|nr:putative L-ascorbate-6-phosphate lactonase UlaG [Streptococcus pneumoniae]